MTRARVVQQPVMPDRVRERRLFASALNLTARDRPQSRGLPQIRCEANFAGLLWSRAASPRSRIGKVTEILKV